MNRNLQTKEKTRGWEGEVLRVSNLFQSIKAILNIGGRLEQRLEVSYKSIQGLSSV